MSSRSSSSSGTGGRSPRPLPPRSDRPVLRWLAAVLAAAAAVWTPLAVLFAGGSVAALSLLAAVLAVGAYISLALRPRRWVVGSLAAGIVLNLGALFGAFLILFSSGSCDDDGHVDWWMWGAGIVVVAGGAAWALQRPWRTWWGLPAATIMGAIVVAVLATLVTGSTGACLD